MADRIDKKIIFILISMPVILFLLPVAFIYAVGGTAGLAFMVICLLITNPLYFVLMGYICGNNVKKYWFLPLTAGLFAAVFLRILLGIGFSQLIYYCVVYLFCAALSMIAHIFTIKNKNKEKLSHKQKIIVVSALFLTLIMFFLISIVAVRI